MIDCLRKEEGSFCPFFQFFKSLFHFTTPHGGNNNNQGAEEINQHILRLKCVNLLFSQQLQSYYIFFMPEEVEN